jgi:hypothetical protein
LKTHFIYLAALLLLSCNKEVQLDRRKSIPDQTAVNTLKINEFQAIGSHNSYKIRADLRLLTFLKSLDFILPAEYQTGALDYTHETLQQQLDVYNMRSFEIDIYADPAGGRFYSRLGNFFANKPVESGIDALNEPGFKVLHIPDIDFETHFYTFKHMLQSLKDWSDMHPNHLPVFIYVETKESSVGDVLGFLGFTTALPYTADLCNAIDLEIKSVFGNSLDKVITPDNIRGSYPTLEAAVLDGNWPTIGASRGKFIFVMNGGAEDEYLSGHPSLANRVMFLFRDEPGTPESAILIYNNPERDQTKIRAAVENGYIVRTRADGPNEENRSGNYSKQEAAFRSGAQIITTDYYRPDPRYLTQPNQFTGYKCQFPNGELARINPVNAADRQNIGVIAE